MQNVIQIYKWTVHHFIDVVTQLKKISNHFQYVSGINLSCSEISPVDYNYILMDNEH